MAAADPFDRWLTSLRVEAAASERVRVRHLAMQAEEQATFAGVLLDLAEHRSPVGLQTATGRGFHGIVANVGNDFVVVDGRGMKTLVALAAVVTVRLAGGTTPAPRGDRSGPSEPDLASVLAVMAGDRPRVSITTASAGSPLTGELRAVGTDVVVVRTDGSPPGTGYVRSASIESISVLTSG